MKLTDLIRSTDVIKIISYIDDIEINEITIQSRAVKKNSLFIAQKGLNFDGHNFIEEAIINGASAVVLEKEKPELNIPQIIVKNTRMAYATICSEFYGNPKNRLKIIGITGTNGKTSCSLFLAQILNYAQKKCAVIGTLGAFFKDKEYSSNLTTPDPNVFHKLLKEFADNGAEYVVMECSAHSIFLDKLFNIQFEVGILTNITQDHLDFFKNMQIYANTKLSFFHKHKIKYKIINADDKYCTNLLNFSNFISYGLKNPADIFAVNVELLPQNSSFVVNALDNVFEVYTNLTGEFNVYNILAVIAAAMCVGVSLDAIITCLKNMQTPPGRFNIFNLDNNRTVIVDFAHTPDGLKKAIIAAKNICKGKIISLFGCGGDRDKSKRPIMGKIAEKLSDFVILTSDNPRFEKPEKILADIEKGFNGHNYFKIANRSEAISTAIKMLNSNDCLLVLGKGGELYQDINGIKIPYNDFDEIEKNIKS